MRVFVLIHAVTTYPASLNFQSQTGAMEEL